MPASANWFTIENRVPIKDQPGKKSSRIKIHGVIGGGWLSDGISAKAFLNQLEMLGEVDVLDVEIDTPGGAVDDGLTIYDALRTHPADVTTRVVGLAASMGSVLMLAGEKRQIAENGRVMVHKITGGFRGTHEEMARMAEILKQNEDQIIRIYMARTGLKEKPIRAMMNTLVGTWFFGADAITKGFATEVIPGMKAAAFHGEWAGYFDFIPAALIDMPATPNPADPTHNSTDMKPEEIVALVTKTIGEQLAASNKTHTDAITAMRDGIGTAVTAALKPALDEAVKPITDRLTKVEAFGDELKKITDLTARLEKAEGLIKAGVPGAAGGTKPVEGSGNEDEEMPPDAPKNEAELEAALGKCKNMNERIAMMRAFRKTRSAA